MLLRLATLDDAEAIRAIYNVEVETATSTFDLVARSLDEQRIWLAERTGALAVVVAVEDERVIGFSSLSHYKERAAYRTTVEDSVYVHRDFHGRGVGRALLTEICTIARDKGFHTVIARIESGGAASIATHKACGFSLVGTEVEVGRKFGRWLSVTVMQRLL